MTDPNYAEVLRAFREGKSVDQLRHEDDLKHARWEGYQEAKTALASKGCDGIQVGGWCTPVPKANIEVRKNVDSASEAVGDALANIIGGAGRGAADATGDVAKSLILPFVFVAVALIVFVVALGKSGVSRDAASAARGGV